LEHSTATALAGALIASARKPAEIDERLRLVVSLLPEADRAALAAAAEAQAASRRAESPPRRLLRRSRPRSPDRQASIERRRAVAGSGMLPPWLRKRCTQGVAAGLTVMANGWKRGRPCQMPVAKIAGLAGVCHTFGPEAMRFMRSGLGRVTPHRQPGGPNLPNSVEIIDPEWQTWIELRRQGANLDSGFEPPQRERGGLRKISPADSNTYRPDSIKNDSVATEPRPAQRKLPSWFTEFRASLPP
jgi:hypothetical protein